MATTKLQTPKRLTAFGQIIRESLFICLIALVLGLVSNALRPDGLSVLMPLPPAKPVSDETDSPVRTISLDAAIGHYQNQTAVFVDARPRNVYQKGHIAGAKSLPDQEFDNALGPFFESVDPAVKIITYCDGLNCRLSKDLGEKLLAIGYEDVTYLPDGWRLWQERGMPIDNGGS